MPTNLNGRKSFVFVCAARTRNTSGRSAFAFVSESEAFRGWLFHDSDESMLFGPRRFGSQNTTGNVTEPAAEGGYEDDIPAAAAAGAKNSWKVTGSALRITSTKIAIEQCDYAGSFMCTYSLKFDEE